MAVISNVNPNFPSPGIDQSSKGFRDNFTIIKTEIERLQGKTISLTGDVSGGPVMIDSGTNNLVISTTSLVIRQSFVNANLSAGVLIVNHNLNQQFVIVQVSNNLNQVIVPDLVTLTNSNSLTIDLSSYGVLSGTWAVIIRA
jgi:hypothetical protein